MLKVILSMSLKLASVCFFCNSLNFVPNVTFLNEVRHSPSCPTETSEPSDLDHGESGAPALAVVSQRSRRQTYSAWGSGWISGCSVRGS